MSDFWRLFAEFFGFALGIGVPVGIAHILLMQGPMAQAARLWAAYGDYLLPVAEPEPVPVRDDSSSVTIDGEAVRL